MAAITLHDLVVNNNFEGVQQFIRDTKKERPYGGLEGYIIGDACRDAIQLGHERIVQLFLDEGLKADQDAYVNGTGYVCPLKYFAARVGNLSLVQLLVNKGARIQVEDGNHYNEEAMRAAIEGGHTSIVQYLLEKGGSANGFVGGRTFLGRAAFDGKKNIFRLLVDRGAQIKNALTHNEEKFKNRYNGYNRALSRYSENDRERFLKHRSRSEEEVKRWDQERQELTDKRNALLLQYTNAVKLILDCAVGTHFNSEKAYSGLTFLKNVDVSGFNFVGVSVDGQPITREILSEQGLKGVDKAIVTYNDISSIEDKERQESLTARLEAMLQSQGKFISPDGIVNLVPLADAAEKGFLDTVRMRLSAGINPNQVTTQTFSSIPAIVAAAKHRHSKIARVLAEHPEIDKKAISTAAHEAKKNGKTKLAEYLYSLSDVNEKDLEGNAQIHKAAMAGNISEVKRLLSKGANIELANGKGQTPLSIALKIDNIELLEFLLLSGANPNNYMKDWHSPLHEAKKSFKALEILLPITEKTDIKYINSFREEVIIPWYVPIMFDSFGSKDWIQILGLLKTHGADLNATYPNDDETILHLFIRWSTFTRIMDKIDLLKRSIGEEPSSASQRELENPSEETKELFELLIEKNIDLKITRATSITTLKILFGIGKGQDRFVKPAHSLSQEEYEIHIEEVKELFMGVLAQLNFLLENGADPKIICSVSKDTPLHVFIRKIKLDSIKGATEAVIDLFLKYGMDVDTVDAYGETPLHEAIRANNVTAAAYLISKGANINAATKGGITPLHLAAAGKPQITKLLLKAGASISAVDEKGRTPLVYSSEECIDKEDKKPFQEAQKELIEAGEKRLVIEQKN